MLLTSTNKNNPANGDKQGLLDIAFADEGDNEDQQQSVDQNKTGEHSSEDNQKTGQTSGEHKSEDGNQQFNQDNHTENIQKSKGEMESENNQQLNIQNKTASDNQSENETPESHVEKNQTSDDVENEINNEKATHHQTEQETSDIEQAKTNQTIAAEIDIGTDKVNPKSIDNNVAVRTINSTNDAVNLSVSATNQTGPKVILINLNSTTIDVANVKYLHVMYDGHPITPAVNVNDILHTTSSDQPHYAILITQSGAQILISIPHFSTHTITLSSISKVMPTVPEFPLSVIVVFVMMIAATIAITRKRLNLFS